MKLIPEDLVRKLHTVIEKGFHPSLSYEVVTSINIELSRLEAVPEKKKRAPKKTEETPEKTPEKPKTKGSQKGK